MAASTLIGRLRRSAQTGRLNILMLMIEVIARLPGVALYRRRAFVPHQLQSNGAASTPSPLTSEQIEHAGRIAHALFVCQRRSPFRLNCLTLALTGQRMLRRRGIPSRIEIGVSTDPDTDKLLSHAWLYVGGRVVTGGLPDSGFRLIWTSELG